MTTAYRSDLVSTVYPTEIAELGRLHSRLASSPDQNTGEISNGGRVFKPARSLIVGIAAHHLSKTVTFDQLFASNCSMMDLQARCRDGSLQA